MGQRITVRIYISYRWWLHPYLSALAAMMYLTGMQPDPVKLERMVLRGTIVKHEEVR